jgi:hypothetical protein
LFIGEDTHRQQGVVLLLSIVLPGPCLGANAQDFYFKKIALSLLLLAGDRQRFRTVVEGHTRSRVTASANTAAHQQDDVLIVVLLPAAGR